MKKHWLFKLSTFLMVVLISAGQALSTVSAMPNLATNSKTLIVGRAIATWPSDIPAGEKRPVIVFLPGWGGVGAVNASVSGRNLNLVNQGYVTLAIGFDSSATWISDINVKTAQGLDALCADASIPANCDAIVLDGSSYGGAQNYWVIEYLLDHGYAGKALGFLSEDAGYGAPGYTTDYNTGAYTRTGLADTASYSVAMIENLGDTTFPVDECTWGNCGARELGDAHQARGDTNVFSVCPPGGSHGSHTFPDWNAWVVSAIKTMIHVVNGVPTFTGYTNPTLSVSNTCVSAPQILTLPVISSAAQDGYILESTETSKVGGALNSSSAVFILGDNARDKQYRAILSFDLSALPAGAVVTKATLNIRKYGQVGADPFVTLGKIMVDINAGAFGNNNDLQSTDFQAAAYKNAGAVIQNTPVSNWYSAVFPAASLPFLNLTGVTQFRLRFQLDDNDNAVADFLKFYSGDHVTVGVRPTLIIEYHVP